jgi:hypothetical protein
MTEHDWREHALGPPSPIPDWLRPLRSPLGPEDLRVAPSTAELRVIARLLDHERIAGQALVTMRDGSPWLEIDIAVPMRADTREVVAPEMSELAPGGVYRYAIWRYTAKAYRIDEHGAAEDDPIDLDARD